MHLCFKQAQPKMCHSPKVYRLFPLKNIVFTIFSGIHLNLVVSVLYYHLTFLSNIETQVGADIIIHSSHFYIIVLKVKLADSFLTSSSGLGHQAVMYIRNLITRSSIYNDKQFQLQ